MPEFYIEPLTDRRVCFKCNKTGKKKFFKCGTCEAITYCSVECQREDWTRHEWNCVPVMVTEIPGKGRGLVAAKDIKMGELIFKEEPSIKLSSKPGSSEGIPVDPDSMKSFKNQLENLPVGAKLQFYKLKQADDSCLDPTLSDYKAFKLFVANNVELECSTSKIYAVFLNLALVNHSCVPNAAWYPLYLDKQDDDPLHCEELKAIKNISKGEEVTTCYYTDVKEYGSIQRKRKAEIKKRKGFDCKCPVCLGQVPCQEKILKKLIELHTKLNPTSSNWKRDAGIRDKIADLTLELYMVQPNEKLAALESLAVSAGNAGDQGLVRKALDKLKQLADDTKLERIQAAQEDMERKFAAVD